ncbi:MAG: hypothetical protein QOF33_4661 [Thermomicrobiales bacterium]|nr:hypothetical protein [Thermomicrobiales bacterium]
MLVWGKPRRPQLGTLALCARCLRESCGRWGSLSAVAILVAIMALALTPHSARGDGIAYVNTDVLNLRDGPGTWAGVLNTMWQGEAVDVLDGPTDDGWYQVSYGGEVGWAYGGYLAIDGESGWYGGDDSGGVGGFWGSAWVSTDLLNMRAWASTDADVLDLLVQGEEVTVTGIEQNGFVPVSAHGVSAWVWSGYLAYDGPAETGPERWIDVDRSSRTVTLYVGDEAIATYWASFGFDESAHGFYSTAVGTYYVFAKHGPLAWTDWGKAYIESWVAFDPERDNGFHSYSMDANGRVLSNGDGPTGGCVATEPGAAREIFDFASVGTRVEVHQ